MRGQNKTPRLGLLLLSLTVLFSVSGFDGCSQEPDDSGYQIVRTNADRARNIYLQDPAEKDSALTLLANMDTRAMENAFDALQGLAYTRYERTDQFNQEGLLTAFLEHIYRVSPASEMRIASDSAGSFDYGLFKKLDHVTRMDRLQKLITRYIRGDGALFMTRRGQDLFVFRIQPDTLMWNHMASTVEILARPGVADMQGLKRLRLYIDRGTGTLIGVAIVQTDLTIFSKEQSLVYMDLRWHNGRWLPHNTRVEALVHIPFADTRHFRAVRTFKDFEPADAI